METSSSLQHTRWECKYHGVWIPKHRRKTLYGQLRQYLGEVFHALARRRKCAHSGRGWGRSMCSARRILRQVKPGMSTEGTRSSICASIVVVDSNASCFQGGDLFVAGLVAEGVIPYLQRLQVRQVGQWPHIHNLVVRQG